MRMKINLPAGLVAVSDQAIPRFNEEFDKWETEAGKSLPNKSGATTILEFINNMGKVGRKKGKVVDNSIGNFSPLAPIPQFITLAKGVGKNKPLSEDEANAISDLKEYIDNNDNPESKVNPANIKFNTITDYDEDEEGNGKASAFGEVYGDYRTAIYVRFRNQYKDDDISDIPTSWYSTDRGKANPPVWQAIWGRKDSNDFFKSESLREICEKFEGLLNELTFQTKRDAPLKVGGNGTAEFLMQNVPSFRQFVLSTVNDVNNYKLPNGKYRAKRAMDRQRRNPTAYPLNDAQSQALLSHLNSKLKIDLDNIYLDVNWRQLEHAAKMLPEYKRLGYGQKKEKPAVSEKKVQKSQEKSRVSLSWKEIMKVRT